MINRKFIKFYKILKILNPSNQPIFLQFLLIIGIIFIVIFTSNYVLFSKFRQDKESSSINAIEQENYKIASKLDECYNDLASFTRLPLFAYTDTGNLNNNFFDILEKFNKTNDSSLELYTYVEKYAYNVFNYRKYIDSVYFFNIYGNMEYKTHTNFDPPDIMNSVDQKWYINTRKQIGKPYILGTRAFINSSNAKLSNYFCFAFLRSIINLNINSPFQGIIEINCNTSFFSEICSKALLFKNQRIIIIDTEGNTIYDTEEKNIAKKVNNKLKYIGTSKGKIRNIKINDNHYFVSYQNSELTGWTVINLVSEKELFSLINKAGFYVFIITIILIIISLILIIILTRQIVTPIKRFVHIMELVENGDFDVKIRASNHSEVGQMIKSFNKMVNRLKRLINTVYVDKLIQKDLELQMLQTQINPHFLYNILESIHMVAESNCDDEASIMARSLGKILRYGISKKNEIVTVQQELDNLNDYIMLQKIRFSHLFEIKTHIDNYLLEKKIIKLILQPIVENSINHGLSGRSSEGLIKISGRIENNLIIFDVEDNGIGMDATQLMVLNDYINDLNDNLNSIGLRNVNKRIKLFYGEEYGVRVTSVPGYGTNVRISIPLFGQNYKS